jgi:hypothetical protein
MSMKGQDKEICANCDECKNEKIHLKGIVFNCYKCKSDLCPDCFTKRFGKDAIKF